MQSLRIPCLLWPEDAESESIAGQVLTRPGSDTVITLEGEGSHISGVLTALEEERVVRGIITDRTAVPAEVVDGIVADLTVFGPLRWSTYHPDSGPTSCDLAPQLVVVGYGPSTKSPRFDTLVIEYDQLQGLMPRSLDLDYGFDPDVGIGAPIVRTNPFSFSASQQGMAVTASHLRRQLPNLDDVGMVSFRAAPVFVAEAELGLTLDEWIMQIVDPIRDLVTLVSGRPAVPTFIRLGNKDHEGFVRSVTPLTEVVGESRYRWEGRDQALFRFDGSGPDPGALVTAWLVARASLETTVDLMYLSRYKRLASSEVRFLLAFQALESFHRTGGFTNERWTSDEFRDLTERIAGCEGLSSEQREWIAPRLQHNEVSQRRRLLKVLSPFAGPFAGIYRPDLDRFTEVLVTSRNVLTHRPTETPPMAVTDDHGLALMAEILTLVLETHLLERAGLNLADAAEIVRDSERYKDVFSYWIPHLVRIGLI